MNPSPPGSPGDARPSLSELVRKHGSRGTTREFLGDHLSIEPATYRWQAIADITLGCNLDCPFCWSSKTRFEVAADAVLEAMAEAVRPHAEEISFGCRHEATLHPELPAVIRSLSEARDDAEDDTRLILLTSGSRLDDTLSDALIDSGLRTVLFSIESTDPEIYARLRTPAQWSDVRPRIAGFVARCRGLAVNLGAQALILRSTLPTLVSTMVELAEIGLQTFGASQVYAVWRDMEPDVLNMTGDDAPELERVIAELRTTGRGLGVIVRAPVPAPAAKPGDIYPLFGNGRVWDVPELRAERETVCAAPWTKVRVDHRGYVFPCQLMLSSKVAWGNVLETPFEEIVNGTAAIDMRTRLLKGEAPNANCQKCPFGPLACG